MPFKKKSPKAVDPRIKIEADLKKKLDVQETAAEKEARIMKTRLDESCQIKFFRQQKNLEDTVTKNYDTLNKSTLKLTRNIGHKEDIPGSG